MQHARTFTVALLVAVIAALAPAQAIAKAKAPTTTSANAIVQACKNNNDSLPGHYSAAALSKAYGSIPVPVREYTPCAQVILNKLNSVTKAIKPSGSGGGSGFPVVIVLVIVVLLVGGGGAFYSYRRSRGTQE